MPISLSNPMTQSKIRIKQKVKIIRTTAAAAIVKSKFVRIILIIATGRVYVFGEVKKKLTATSSIEKANAKTEPATIPVRASGNVISQKACP